MSLYRRSPRTLVVLGVMLCLLCSTIAFSRTAWANSRRVVDMSEVSGFFSGSEDDLQRTIDEAGSTPTRIVLSWSDTMLTRPLVIPEGADIEIVNASREGFETQSALVREDGYEGTLVKVAKGAKLTLDKSGEGGRLEIRSRGQVGQGNIASNAPTVLVQGELTIQDATISGTRGMTEFFQGAVTVTGADAILTMNGGLITDNHRKQDPSYVQRGAGNVAVAKGATFIMNGGSITEGRGSEVSGNSYGEAGGVGVYEGGHFVMKGGDISDNAGFGGGVVAYTWADGSDVKAAAASGNDMTSTRSTVELWGGSIKSNESGFGGGGVLVFGNAELTMHGGEITDNTAPCGGGVCAMDLYKWGAARSWAEIDGEGGKSGLSPEEYSRYQPGGFTMHGGTIARNSSSRTGGGVNVVSNAVRLYGGDIRENHADMMGGGVYVATKTYTAHFHDMSVHENAADVAGGGIWVCPTGKLTLNVTHGAIIEGGQAGRHGDDIAHLEYGGVGSFPVFLSDHVLGGGEVSYFWDGGVKAPGGSRFDPDSPGERVVLKGGEEDTITNSGLHSVAADDGAELARAMATLRIHQNSSSFVGGGIGSNGGIAIGEPETFELEVTKRWKNGLTGDDLDLAGLTKTEVNAGVVVSYQGKDYLIRRFTISAQNGWKAKVVDLPTVDPAGEPISYKVVELDEKGEAIVASTTRLEVTGEVNHLAASLENRVVSLDVTKSWVYRGSGEPADEQAVTADMIRLGIYRTAGASSEKVGLLEVRRDAGWTAELKDLPVADANGNDYSYWAVELAEGEEAPEAEGIDDSRRLTFSRDERRGSLALSVVNEIEPPVPPAPPTPPASIPRTGDLGVTHGVAALLGLALASLGSSVLLRRRA